LKLCLSKAIAPKSIYAFSSPLLIAEMPQNPFREELDIRVDD
jgi:hypothetical protein